MRYLALLLGLVMLHGVWAQGQETGNLVKDGTFAEDADGNGLADAWQFVSGADPQLIEVTFGREELSPGHFAQRISCSRLEGGHAMLAQTGVVAVKEGEWYRLRLRARGEGLSSLSVDIRDANGWKSCGPNKQFAVGKRWRDYDFRFQASGSCSQTSRFQIWFASTGTASLSDVSLTTAQAPPPANVIADEGSKNMLPNGGFEAFGGWGIANSWTYGWQVAAGQGVAGSNCAAIKWQPQDPAQRYYFDYFLPDNRPPERPMLQPIGYLPLERNAIYTLSAYMKTDMEGVPAVVGFTGPGGSGEIRVKLTKEWQRVVMRCRASGPLTAVQVGPDLREQHAEEFPDCTVYVDNAQLEKAEKESDFEARPLEVFFSPSEISFVGGPGYTTLEAAVQIISAQAGTASVTLKITDTFDKPVETLQREVPVQAGVTETRLSLKVPGSGFYRLNLAVKVGERMASATARRAVCLSSPVTENSAFGTNHAYSYDGLVTLAKSLGVTWVRNWSLRWDQVEWQPGKLRWDAVDEQINRLLALKVNLLCMFPFPSAEWSSSAPTDPKELREPRFRIRQAYAPKDWPAMGRYMAACVNRYKGRVNTWEIFNESIYTDYSLPKTVGYKAADYVPLLGAAYEGCKSAAPNCLVIGGYSAPPARLDLYGAMFEGGGLQKCDLVSLHDYPSDAPEYLQKDFDALNQAMAGSGGRTSTWMTEFAYYADDDPDQVKLSNPAPVENELVQASWNTRACVIMLANGVERIFYHIWPTTLNRDLGTQIFFEYGGAPRKIAPAQAALNFFLGPEPKFAARATELDKETSLCYVFAAPPHVTRLTKAVWVAAAWAPYEAVSMPLETGWKCYDLCGKPLAGAAVEVGPQPVWVCAEGGSAEGLAAAIAKKLAAQ